jgi:hypothetical protein
MREEKERERKERKNKMTPLLQRLCVVCVLAFCSVQTRVETFATHKKKDERKK